MDNQLVVWNPDFVSKILKFQNIEFEKVGKIYKISGFEDYNYLVDINSLFSTAPAFSPVDRTAQQSNPFNIWIDRAWQAPVQQLSLEQALERRVLDLCQRHNKINLMWSGGIDSTTMVTAFLKHAPDYQQIRILWSPWSSYEHPGYIEFLKKFPVETVDTSGTMYLHTLLDGIFLTGEGGDELTASIDESFFESHSHNLNMPWQSWFRQQGASDMLIDWSEKNFMQAQRPIESVLHARWWFYTAYKNSSMLREKMQWIFDLPRFKLDQLQGFFNCSEFESWVFYNVESVMAGNEYCQWKQPLKDYCFAFDNFEHWHRTKAKHGSFQMMSYVNKKIALKNQYWIALLSNGERLSTPSLPFLTQKEWNNLGNYQHLFNHAKHI